MPLSIRPAEANVARLLRGDSKRPPSGRIANRYDLVEELASGGMGCVYRAIDRSTNVEVALKRARLEPGKEDFVRESFEREFQILAGLDHPRIIRVYDYGVDDDGPYYTMELVPGDDVRGAAPLPLHDACLCLRDLATSLALLHARRLLHRDLSPSNARITPDGRCKLLDFGALTTFGRPPFIVGTPPVVPPEVLEETPLDQRADLFALGALGYFMLTGEHAFPASTLSQLPDLWERAPIPPSELAPHVPPDLDALILSMISTNPLARPASAAEVIVRLGVIGDLPAEKEGDLERLAQSFLSSPRFTGRTEELAELEKRVTNARSGRGGAVLITAASGMGRTRLLDELGLRAQIAGATVLRVDASIDRQQHGTARALVMRLFDTLPEVAREKARRYRGTLAALGREVERRLPTNTSVPPRLRRPAVLATGDSTGDLEDWFASVSRGNPLIVLADNVESADAASLGFLAGLAKLAPEVPILLVAAERTGREASESVGMNAIRTHCAAMPLHGLDRNETLELVRSLFGETPHVARFAEWVHGRTTGCPLHCVEISRQLVARQVIRYVGGMWVLPAERPEAELPSALDETLAMRLDLLGEEARGLAECLSLVREPPTFQLCRLLVNAPDEGHVHSVLDELASNDVLHLDGGEYRFSSAGLREAVLSGMDPFRRRHNHRRLGEVLGEFAGPDDPALRMEAGWHLIRGGDASSGAEMIAEVTHDSAVVRKMIANLHPSGEPIEAALKVFKRERRSKRERMPLLAALSFAGYYEAPVWGERYGDEALDAIEDLSGLQLARRLRPFLGRVLSLVVGLTIGAVRFYLSPKRERPYSFRELLTQLFSLVTTLTGAAIVVLDVERAKRVTNVLKPFSVLPNRLTPAGIYQECAALREIGTDNPAAASATFELLAERFEDKRYYPSLDDDGRLLSLSGALFAHAACKVMHRDGKTALELAEALDGTGLKLYRMIASQLRYLYYMNRGELTKAIPHRDQVEIHAAHVGSAWQVESWEPASLIPVCAQIGDVIALTRLEERLAVLSQSTPSLERYYRYARAARVAFSQDRFNDEQIRFELARCEEDLLIEQPRAFIGWAAVHGFVARAYNMMGEHEKAQEMCQRARAHVTDADREYTALFQSVDIELAIAEAGLGHTDEALKQIDALIERDRDIDHPLVHGLLHEARARIALGDGRLEIYRESLTAMEEWLLPTGTPALVTRCKRLAEMAGYDRENRMPTSSVERGSTSARSSKSAMRKAPDRDPIGTDATTLDADTVMVRRKS